MCAAGDAHHVAAKIKGEVSHRSTDVEQQGRKAGQEVGAKVDHAVSFVLGVSIDFVMS